MSISTLMRLRAGTKLFFYCCSVSCITCVLLVLRLGLNTVCIALELGLNALHTN